MMHHCFNLDRCGMSGEPAPRYIIRSQVTMKPYGQVRVLLPLHQYMKYEESAQLGPL